MRIIPTVASHVSTNDGHSVGVILETTRPDNFSGSPLFQVGNKEGRRTLTLAAAQ
jgi:hypothetical protein